MPNLKYVAAGLLLACTIPGVASADPMQDARTKLLGRDWNGAKKILTAITSRTCQEEFLLGYADANLGDGDGTAVAELAALPCLDPKSKQDAINLLAWSIGALGNERLGPPKYPWVQNPKIVTKPNARYAQRAALVNSMMPYIPRANIELEFAMSLNPCNALDVDFTPTPDEQNACWSYSATLDPVPAIGF